MAAFTDMIREQREAVQTALRKTRAKSAAKKSKVKQRKLLVPLINKLLRTRATAFANGQKTETFRASGLYKLCPRRHILMQIFPEIEPKVSSSISRTMMAFAIGTSTHEMFQNNIMPGLVGIGAKVEGYWRCSGCGELVAALPVISQNAEARHVISIEKGEDGKETKRKECWRRTELPNSRTVSEPGRFQYIEPEAIYELSPKFKLKGHCDAIFNIEGLRYILELKTCRGDLYSQLEAAMDDHVFQANVYMWLFEVGRAIIAYMSKDTHYTKEFHYEKDPAIQEEIQRRLKNWLKAQDGEMTDRICETPNDIKAKRCGWVEACFNDMKLGPALEKWKRKQVEGEQGKLAV